MIDPIEPNCMFKCHLANSPELLSGGFDHVELWTVPNPFFNTVHIKTTVTMISQIGRASCRERV